MILCITTLYKSLYLRGLYDCGLELINDFARLMMSFTYHSMYYDILFAQFFNFFIHDNLYMPNYSITLKNIFFLSAQVNLNRRKIIIQFTYLGGLLGHRKCRILPSYRLKSLKTQHVVDYFVFTLLARTIKLRC